MWSWVHENQLSKTFLKQVATESTPHYISIKWFAPGTETDFCHCIPFYIHRFSISSLFSAFQVLSSLCIFRVCFSFTFWNFPIFLDSGFFTYCFVYFQVFYIFDIFRSYYIFCILEFFVFSSLLCFSYLLYFKFPLPLPIGFLSQKYFIYLPICIKELTTVFPISVMLKDLWLLWWRIKS